MTSRTRGTVLFLAGTLAGLVIGILAALLFVGRGPDYVLTNDLAIGTRPSSARPGDVELRGTLFAGSPFISYGRKGVVNYIQFSTIVAVPDQDLRGHARAVRAGEVPVWELGGAP